MFLAKLPREIARRIVNKVNSIKDSPYHFLEHYEGADFYKLRVGAYRLLVDVDVTKTLSLFGFWPIVGIFTNVGREKMIDPRIWTND